MNYDDTTEVDTDCGPNSSNNQTVARNGPKPEHFADAFPSPSGVLVLQDVEQADRWISSDTLMEVRE